MKSILKRLWSILLSLILLVSLLPTIQTAYAVETGPSSNEVPLQYNHFFGSDVSVSDSESWSEQYGLSPRKGDFISADEFVPGETFTIPKVTTEDMTAAEKVDGETQPYFYEYENGHVVATWTCTSVTIVSTENNYQGETLTGTQSSIEYEVKNLSLIHI